MEFFLILWVLCAIGCAMIASSKNLNVVGWFFGGLVLGIIGLLIVGFSEKKPVSDSTPKTPPLPIWKRPFELPSDKVCPKCAETIKFVASVCRYCGNTFDNVASESERLHREYDLLVEQKKVEQQKQLQEQQRQSVIETVIESKRVKKQLLIAIPTLILIVAGIVIVQLLMNTPNPPIVKNERPIGNSSKVGGNQLFLMTPNKPVLKKEVSLSKHPKTIAPQSIGQESKPPIHRWFVRVRYSSGSIVLFALDEMGKYDSHMIGDAVRPVPMANDMYILRDGDNVVSGILIAKFDSLVYH